MELFQLLILAAMGAAVPLAMSVAHRRQRAELAKWRRVMERLGLSAFEPSLGLGRDPRLTARGEGRRVHLSRQRLDRGTSFTWVTVEGDSGISLQPEATRTLLTRPLGEREREIELGDEEFDRVVEIRGAPERVRALLDVETRGIVLRMLEGQLAVPGERPLQLAGRVVLSHGHLQASLADQPRLADERELGRVLRGLLALAPRFARPVNPAERLAAALAVEPLWPVRMQGLVLLLTSYPLHPATHAAARRALDDEQPAVALQAALALGEEGEPTLRRILVLDRIDDAVAAHAVHALGERLSVEQTLQLLQRSLRRRQLQTADACLHQLGRRPTPAAEPMLAKVLRRESGALVAAAARALRCGATPEIEAALVEALTRGDEEVTLAAIAALGRVGSIASVLRLQEAAKRPGSGAEARRGVRQAVAAIQARRPGASPGQLSLAQPASGQLSLADDPRGRVSLSEAG